MYIVCFILLLIYLFVREYILYILHILCISGMEAEKHSQMKRTHGVYIHIYMYIMTERQKQIQCS